MPEDARVVFLALSEDGAERFLAERPTLAESRLVYDVSGYAKRIQDEGYALGPALFEAGSADRAGLMSNPACFASAVLVPLWYLSLHCGVGAVRDVHAVGIGGRTTLGAAGYIEPGSFRTSSRASEARHGAEIAKFCPIPLGPCDLQLLVGDLDSGILTAGNLSVAGAGITQPISVSLNAKNLDWVREDVLPAELERPLVSRQSVACRFDLAPGDQPGHIRLRSFIHNLDFPLSVVLAHLERAMPEFFAPTREEMSDGFVDSH